LNPGEEVEHFPADILAVDWPDDAFHKSLLLKYRRDPADPFRVALMQDIGVDIDWEATPPGTIPVRARLVIRSEELSIPLSFAPGDTPMYAISGHEEWEVDVESGGEAVPLVEFLNNHPLVLWLSDCSRLEGQNHYRNQSERRPIPDESFVAVDWAAHGVDICTEYIANADPQPDDGSIHGYVIGEMRRLGAAVIAYDHGAYEAADVIAIWDEPERVRVKLFHCKSTREERAGCRLVDIYEVAGQATKCLRWVYKPAELIEHLERRSRGNAYRFQVGRLRDVDSLLRRNPKRVQYEIAIVQPGLSIGALSDAAADVLAAANEYVRRDLGGRNLEVMGSA